MARKKSTVAQEDTKLIPDELCDKYAKLLDADLDRLNGLIYPCTMTWFNLPRNPNPEPIPLEKCFRKVRLTVASALAGTKCANTYEESLRVLSWVADANAHPENHTFISEDMWKSCSSPSVP